MKIKRSVAALAIAASAALGTLAVATPAQAVQNTVKATASSQPVQVRNLGGQWTLNPGWQIYGVESALVPSGKCLVIDVVGTTVGDRTVCVAKPGWVGMPGGTVNITLRNWW